MAVGGFRRGRSQEGVEELAGNVSEWMRSLYERYGARGYAPDYSGERRERVGAPAESLRLVRGGGFYCLSAALRSA